MLKDRTQYKDTMQSSEPDSDTAEILELLDQGLKSTMVHILRSLVEKKKDSIQQQMGNKGREMEIILRKNQKETLETNKQNTVK